MEQEKWGSHVDYMMTLIGYSIGVGCMWKFPYMCMRNGGGAFLIPFIVFMIIGAVPCVFLEMVIGQFSQSGAVKVWNLCPPFKGVGMGNVLIGIFYSTYYSALFAWLIYYFYHSFSPNIPWSNCDNPWNTPSCIRFDDVGDDASANATNVSVVYITVGVPYILITMFLIRGCLLPGSADGIYFYIYPHFERLLDPKVKSSSDERLH
ncbi:sodium- and chloride-dependent GABA transporter 2-like [Haliotis rubra]|uniref:sodium- and chloride-dependent GABA transporter 2-like n=1 Tax=Haliotis rubra TaxID=36100 RepID=UPI001EE52275|nr:sodium- and chloride-dependent GABA transporter 2-like [Haliotis rubra]